MPLQTQLPQVTKEHLGNVDSCLQTSFKPQNTSSRAQKQALKYMLELLGKFQMPNQIAAWQLDDTTWPIYAVLVENDDALLLAIVFFFHIPINGGVDMVRVALPTILCVGVVNWWSW